MRIEIDENWLMTVTSGTLGEPDYQQEEIQIGAGKVPYTVNLDGCLAPTLPHPRLFIEDGWYAFQAAKDTIELFHYDVMSDNGTREHYAHYCTVTWDGGNSLDASLNDREDIPWEMLWDIFEGRAA